MNQWTDSEGVIQRDGKQERTVRAPVLVLAPGTDRLIPLFDLPSVDGPHIAGH